MIVRHWHGVTMAPDAEAYTRYLDRTGVADYQAVPGNRGVIVLRRIEGDRAHFDILSFWDSLEAVRAFAGDDVTRARYYPEDDAYLLEREPSVTHHEVAIATGGAPPARGPGA